MTLPVGFGGRQGDAVSLPAWLRRLLGWFDALVGPDARLNRSDREPPAVDWDAVSALVLTMAAGLILVALGHGAGRRGQAILPDLYWVGLAVITIPVAVRLAHSEARRSERLGLVVGLGLSLLAVKCLYAPTALAHFDEFLHWSTAMDIMASHRLFTANPLLPVSPFYPALEIITTSIANLTHLSIFQSSMIVLGIARLVLLLALFLLFEANVFSSPRLAALACLVFLSNPNLVFFHGLFAYETLAISWLVTILSVECGRPCAGAAWKNRLFLTFPLLVALSVTHHVTAYIGAMALCGLAALEFIKSEPSDSRMARIAVAALAIALPSLWSMRVGSTSQGGSLAQYLGPIFAKGFHELLAFLQGGLGGRKLFAATDGLQTPLFLKIMALGSALFAALGIAGGLFSAVAASASKLDWRAVLEVCRRRWRDSGLLLLAALGVGFPITLLLRLTSAGWEIGARMTPFVYLGVALLSALTLMRILERCGTLPARLAVGVMITFSVMGGVVSGWGIPCVRRGYIVSADSLSIEPMSIGAAKWMREWLEPGNRVAADRVNSVLVTTYGGQTPVTGLRDKVDMSSVVLGREFTESAVWALRFGRVDYLVVDLRLTTALPRTGHYFDQTESWGFRGRPPAAAALLKFNPLPGVSRVFDNGSIIIFDVRKVRDPR